jgi:hypothetical protein
MGGILTGFLHPPYLWWPMLFLPHSSVFAKKVNDKRAIGVIIYWHEFEGSILRATARVQPRK